MNDQKYLEQSRKLNLLLRIKKHKLTKLDILEMASLYRNLSAVLSEIKFQSIRSEVENSVMDAHRYLNTVPLSGKKIFHYLFQVLPVAAFRSGYVRLCIVLFYSVFFTSLVGGFLSKDYAVTVLGEATLEQYTDMHKSDERNFDVDMALTGSGYYIVNNVTLDLITYGTGILAGIGSVLFTLYNAIILGTTIGFLLNSPAAAGIQSWIFGHAPFELTAIGFAAGAGLQTGLAMLRPGNRSRIGAVQVEGRRALPALLTSLLLTFTAAFIEGFIAPLSIPIQFKIAIGAVCAIFLLLYFIIPSFKAGAEIELR